MAKKNKLIEQLEAQIEVLTGELANVDKQLRKRIKRAERDAATAREELVKFIAQRGKGKKDSDDGKKASGKKALGDKAAGDKTAGAKTAAKAKTESKPRPENDKPAARTAEPAKPVVPKAEAPRPTTSKTTASKAASAKATPKTAAPPTTSTPSTPRAESPKPDAPATTPPTKPLPTESPARKAVANWPAADKSASATATPAGVPKKAARSGPTVAELKAEAKTKGVKGYSTMNKAELLTALGR